MGNGRSGSTNLWLRLSRWLHASAWLPPGLALAWLATLATLVHNIGILIAAWGTTVCVVLLVVLLATQRRRAAPQDRSLGATTGPQAVTGPASPATDNSAAPIAAETVTTPPARDPDVTSAPQSGSATEVSSLTAELRVLTAEEVASVLRVETDIIITSISKGELPGNRIGSHWRIDQGALMRWLQGPYGDLAGKDPHRLQDIPARERRQVHTTFLAGTNMSADSRESDNTESRSGPVVSLSCRRAGSSGTACKQPAFPGPGKPVTNQVTTTPGNTRRGATHPDTDIPLACGNRT
jgi:excisionase family DNA binding protein